MLKPLIFSIITILAYSSFAQEYTCEIRENKVLGSKTLISKSINFDESRSHIISHTKYELDSRGRTNGVKTYLSLYLYALDIDTSEVSVTFDVNVQGKGSIKDQNRAKATLYGAEFSLSLESAIRSNQYSSKAKFTAKCVQN
jgi:hypothetical protein